MTKREYLNRVEDMPTNWLRACASEPSTGMRPVHVRIIKLALRRRGVAT